MYLIIVLFLCPPLVGVLIAIIAARTGRDPLIWGLGGALMPILVVPLLAQIVSERIDLDPPATMDEPSVLPTIEPRPITSGTR